MEFIKVNLINTTTQIAVNSNTISASNIFNRNLSYQYYSDGLDNDLTTSSVTITFDVTTAVSRIALLDTNVKSFSIYYNGVTANSFTLQGAATTTSSFTSNSETSLYFRTNTVMCSSITLEMKSTIVANQEKAFSLLHYSDNYFTLSLLPSANNYKPMYRPKQIVHKLSDGGTRIHNVAKKWELDITLDFVPTALRDQLYDQYNLDTEFNFVPFGTSASWDKIFFECVWVGDFDFYEYSDNALESGFSGQIKLKETPS